MSWQADPTTAAARCRASYLLSYHTYVFPLPAAAQKALIRSGGLESLHVLAYEEERSRTYHSSNNEASGGKGPSNIRSRMTKSVPLRVVGKAVGSRKARTSINT